jgi:integrase|tara:strand:+ start:185 stop:1384 length:1200 start_codon:yes stop_codon:yes gene_type:complete
MRFTDSAIKGLKPKSARYEKWEGLGFGLRVAPSGRKTFIFLYRFKGLSRRMSLGVYPGTTLHEARKLHAEAKLTLDKEVDPGTQTLSDKHEERLAPTVSGFVTEYLEKWAKPRKKKWAEDERTLCKDVIPYIGRKKMKDVTRRDLGSILDRIIERGSPGQANKTHQILSKMFSFAVSRSVVKHSPVGGMGKPATENMNLRFLTVVEIKHFWEKLDAIPIKEGTALCLKILLLLGQRRGETATLEWKEIDLNSKAWTIPKHKSKNGKAHTVPLPPMAMSIITRAKKLAKDSSYVFPGAKPSCSISPDSITSAVYKNQHRFDMEQFSAHDLRHTVATQLAMAGVEGVHISKVLNHTVPGITAQVYNHHQYDKEKRQALETWERKLKGILFNEVSSNVVNIK